MCFFFLFIKHQYKYILTYFNHVLSFLDTAYREMKRFFPLEFKRAVSIIFNVSTVIYIFTYGRYLHSFMVFGVNE